MSDKQDFLNPHLNVFIDFRERGRERGREKYIDQLPPICSPPQLGIEPTT